MSPALHRIEATTSAPFKGKMGCIAMRAVDHMGAARGTLSSVVDAQSRGGSVIHETQLVTPSNTYTAPYSFESAADTVTFTNAQLLAIGLSRQILYAVFVTIKTVGLQAKEYRGFESWSRIAANTYYQAGCMAYIKQTVDGGASYQYDYLDMTPPTSRMGQYRITAAHSWETHDNVDDSLTTWNLKAFGSNGTGGNLEYYIDQIIFVPYRGHNVYSGGYGGPLAKYLLYFNSEQFTFDDTYDNVIITDTRPQPIGPMDVNTRYSPRGYEYGTDFSAYGVDFQIANNNATVEDFDKRINSQNYWDGTYGYPGPNPKNWYAITAGAIQPPDHVIEDDTFSRTVAFTSARDIFAAGGMTAWGSSPYGYIWTLYSTADDTDFGYVWDENVGFQCDGNSGVFCSISGDVDPGEAEEGGGGYAFTAIFARDYAIVGVDVVPSDRRPILSEGPHSFVAEVDVYWDIFDYTSTSAQSSGTDVDDIVQVMLTPIQYNQHGSGYPDNPGNENHIAVKGQLTTDNHLHIRLEQMLYWGLGSYGGTPASGRTLLLDGPIDIGVVSPGTLIHIKFERMWYYFRAKVWIDGSAEPGWQLTGYQSKFKWQGLYAANSATDIDWLPHPYTAPSAPWKFTPIDDYQFDFAEFSPDSHIGLRSTTGPTETNAFWVHWSRFKLSYETHGAASDANLEVTKWNNDAISYGQTKLPKGSQYVVETDIGQYAENSTEGYLTGQAGYGGVSTRVWRDNPASWNGFTVLADYFMRAPTIIPIVSFSSIRQEELRTVN